MRNKPVWLNGPAEYISPIVSQHEVLFPTHRNNSVQSSVKKYHDYIEMKSEEEKMILWPTLVVGLIFFVVGLIISLIVM